MLTQNKIPPHLTGLASVLISLMTAVPAAWSGSYYTQRLEDSKAVYVSGSGTGDDTSAIQQAIDRVHGTTGQGIVFLPDGRYHISDTLYIWPGIRLIGYGATRPTIVLPANTPGFQDATHEKVMIFFAGSRPGFGRGLADEGVAADS